MGNCPVFVLPSPLFPPSLLTAKLLIHTAFAALPHLKSSSPLLLSFSTLHFSILPSSCSTLHVVLPCLPYLCHTMLSCLLSALLFTNTHSTSHMFLSPIHMQKHCLCAPPSIYKHTQGQNCTNLGILALVSLPVK